MSKKKVGIILGILLIVIVGGVVGSFAIGWLYGGVKSPKQSVVVQYNICDNSIIEEFNKSISSGESLKSVAEKIESNKDYKKDASCVYMSWFYTITINKGDYTGKVKELHDIQSSLAESGKYPNQKIDTLMSISQMERVIGGLPSGKE